MYSIKWNLSIDKFKIKMNKINLVMNNLGKIQFDELLLFNQTIIFLFLFK